MTNMAGTLAWGEIHRLAVEFVAEWKTATSERAEAQLFWNDWFGIFGIPTRRVATYEARAERYSTGGSGRIDVFWPGMLVVEHKSAGRSLDEAMTQALDYLDSVPSRDLPRMVITSDFARFKVRDLESGEEIEFPIEELPNRLDMFGYLAGYRQRAFVEEAAVNVKAAQLMADLYDELIVAGYTGHNLNVFLVRLMFLFFADDTGVWERGLFQDFIRDSTREDGLDTGPMIARLFDILDTPGDARPPRLDRAFDQFPYINGGLFRERLSTPDFTYPMRTHLLAVASFDWSQISPTIFGSMFQGVMDPNARRGFGAHYTTEASIRKLIDPLFVDDLNAEFDKARNSAASLRRLHTKISNLKFLDPAAGAGNFLLVTYRALRELEFRILDRLRDLNALPNTLSMDATGLSTVTVDQFYAIEIEELPARIAETALYLADHLENMRLSREFGHYFTRFPIVNEAHIHIGNALRMDWNTLIPGNTCDFIMGNPPFIGRQFRTAEQVEDMLLAHLGAQGHGVLDYVTAWYAKAVQFMAPSQHPRAAFVSTNSISQGENVPALWPSLFQAGASIDFAVRSFKWDSDAPGRAGVTVVIIGFSLGRSPNPKRIFEVGVDPSTSTQIIRSITVPHISPYLAQGDDSVVRVARSPIVSSVPVPEYGSMANDGGHLIVDPSDIAAFRADPLAAKYLREYVGADEVFKNTQRWCLWLLNADPADIAASQLLRDRVAKVAAYRSSRTRKATQVAAMTPSLFVETRVQTQAYIFVPFVSSEKRRYIPLVIKPAEAICAAPHWRVPTTDLYIMGVMSSRAFSVWAEEVGGRLEMRLRLSPGLAYNTFPFPTATEAARRKVRDCMQLVLEERAKQTAPLAVLYLPTTMPPALAKAHRRLDRAVDSLFSLSQPLDAQRLSALLASYRSLTTPLDA